MIKKNNVEVVLSELFLEPTLNGIYKEKEFHGRGCKVVNMGELFSYDFISNQNMKLVELNEKELKKFLLKDRDLLFARRSLILSGSGKCSIVINPTTNTTFESSIIRIRLDKQKVSPLYYYYYFKSPIGRSKILSFASQTAVSGIRSSDLSKVTVKYPKKEDQERVVLILSNYDTLIENNEKRIKILEQMAKLIYEEWFVKFKFPGYEKVKRIDSKTEFGKIPEGWEVKSIMDIDYFSFINAGIKEFSGEKEYFATANIDGLAIVKKGEIVTYENKPSRAQKEPKINSVWFARMKDSYKVLGVTKINKNIAENSILSSGFAGFESEEKIFPFLFLNINSKRFDDLKNLYATGATQVSLNNDGLANIKIIYPKKEILENFGMFVKPLIDQLLISQLKNQLLRKTRDFLLQKLISGEVDVSELDIKLSEVET